MLKLLLSVGARSLQGCEFWERSSGKLSQKLLVEMLVSKKFSSNCFSVFIAKELLTVTCWLDPATYCPPDYVSNVPFVLYKALSRLRHYSASVVCYVGKNHTDDSELQRYMQILEKGKLPINIEYFPSLKMRTDNNNV